jgi:DNA-binding GntR family transcriptional regulator
LGLSEDPLFRRETALNKGKVSICDEVTYASVAVSDKNDDKVIYDFRQSVEPLAAMQASAHITDRQLKQLFSKCVEIDRAFLDHSLRQYLVSDAEFHFLVFEAAGNEALKSMYNAVEPYIQKHRLFHLTEQRASIPKELPFTLACSGYSFKTYAGYEHFLIYEGVNSRQPEKAKLAMMWHLASHEI